MFVDINKEINSFHFDQFVLYDDQHRHSIVHFTAKFLWNLIIWWDGHFVRFSFFFFIFHVECIIIQIEMYKSAKRFLEHLTNEANNRSEINDMIEVNDMNSGTNLWFILGIASELRSNDKRTNNLDTLTSSEPNFWPPS